MSFRSFVGDVKGELFMCRSNKILAKVMVRAERAIATGESKTRMPAKACPVSSLENALKVMLS
jgi:hypothetical protein